MKFARKGAIIFGSALMVAGTVFVGALKPILAASNVQGLGSRKLNPDPDAVCVSCHREIYEKYRLTPMARGSGLAKDGLLQGEFKHSASGVEYRVFERDGKVWMSYQRAAISAHLSGVDGLHGERELQYFIGSGHRGRTYLYEVSGLWFEAPINYYSKKQIWDMAPNYKSSQTMPGALPVDSNCLHCHATGISTAVFGTRNKYAAVPFTQGGVGCAACHGDSALHVATMGRAPIVNPAKLAPAKRDSICLQCHLEGDAAVFRAGTSLSAFRAGDNLADYTTYFVKASAEAGGGRASSQYEALLRSRCKIASGDKLTCTTCHDPHGSPNEQERVGYFRGKCLSCHIGPSMATEHHPEQQDCAVCHMPTRQTTDISHEQATDHTIQRTPQVASLRFTHLAETGELVPVGAAAVGDRELGLAYAQTAQRGNRRAGEKALQLLEKAEKTGADDAELHVQLAFMKQISGNPMGAQSEYLAALAKDPNDVAALGNLAVLDAASGKTADAIGLLQRVFTADPAQTAAGLNFAFIECSLGDREKAKVILAELRLFNPDDPTLRNFADSGAYTGQYCDLYPTRSKDAAR